MKIIRDAVLCLLLFASAAGAQVPGLLSYQGRLLDGTNLVNGNVGLSLRLFNVPSGGSSLYEDSNSVAVADGLYSTFLGDQTNFGHLAFALAGGTAWIEVAVDGVTLSPRERVASAAYSLVTRGLRVSTNFNPSVVLGGGNNAISNGTLSAASIGGSQNDIGNQADSAAVVGGTRNRIGTTGQRSAIIGGTDHRIEPSALDSALVGGFTNLVDINTRASVIAGGQGNRVEANSFGGFIAGGASNAVAGRYSAAGGHRAKATNTGSFVWADAQDANFGTTASNQFLVRAAGGVGINTNAPAAGGLSVGGPVVAHSLAGNGAGITNLGSASLADGAITGSKIASNSITGAQIADASLGAADVATAPDPRAVVTIRNPNTFFGNDLAEPKLVPVSDSRFVLATPRPNSSGGNAHLLDLSGTLLANLVNPAPNAGDVFGGAVAVLGANRVAIGAPFDDTLAVDAGTVYLYSIQDGSLGALTLTIVNPSASVSENFGRSLAGIPVAGGSNWLVVGTPGEGVGFAAAGAVFLYDEAGGFHGFVPNPVPVVNDQFGANVLAAGPNRYAVAVPGFDAACSNQGRVLLHDVDLGVVAVFTNPVPQTNSAFGLSMCLVGSNRLVIGDSLYDGAGLNEGRAYIFDLSGALLLTITNPSPAAGDGFAASLGAVGDQRFLVGVPGDDTGASGAGLAYLYDLNGNLLDVRTNEQPTASDNFGQAVAGVGGDHFLVASPNEGSFTPLGAVYVYALNERVPGLRAEEVPERSIGEPQLDMAFLDGRYVNVAGDVISNRLTVRGASFPSVLLDNEGSVTGRLWRIMSQDDGTFQIMDNGTGRAHVTVSTNGTMLGTGGVSRAILHVRKGDTGRAPVADTLAVLESTNKTYLSILTATNAEGGIVFGNAADEARGSVVFNNGTNPDGLQFLTGNNSIRMVITSNGFVGIGTAAPTNRLHVLGTVQATAYITTSDRNAKANIQPVSPESILQKVAGLPISTWEFREEPNGTHIGPMAQDFHAAFGFGNTDTGIMTVDADGVSLAAIQALHRENQELRRRIEQLERAIRKDTSSP